MNGLMMQYFEWYLPNDGTLWKKAAEEAKRLAEQGVTALWLPPAYKGAGGMNDVGYAVYDVYDLGEFDQKGSVPTKYGTRKEYLKAIKTLQKNGVQVYADIVLNHRIGADATEKIKVQEVSGKNRNIVESGQETIEAWTVFNFPGRGGKYSDFVWNFQHFDGIDWDQETKRNRIFRFWGKDWDSGVDGENTNYDYLMGADVDFDNPKALSELTKWGKWYLDTTGVDGLRIDAVKHIKADFYKDWLPAMREYTGRELFAVGEYWSPKRERLENYLGEVKGEMSLFDVPLHFNFSGAAAAGEGYDMRHILDGSLTAENPSKAVTFVDNHDTQPGQALSSFVPAWFKPLAYALILLREGGYPCVFYGDYYGIPHDNIAPVGALSPLMTARKKYAYGKQNDYFDDFHIIGWTREGVPEMENSGCAVLMSNGCGGKKQMYIGKQFAGAVFKDLTGACPESCVIDAGGNGVFSVGGGSVSVYVRSESA